MTAPLASGFPLTSLASRYDIERELGRGGMAAVYLARERKHDRRVAIKVLRPEVSAALGADRFLREIGIAARLSHPHLVPLIDSGEADGLLYSVSAYIADGSLRERLARTPMLPVAEALRIANEVGAALDFVHRAGFVHRDVKPENILFADGHALLADFGIARALGDESTRVTGPGIAVGTPAYMSPEQAAGDSEVGARTDIYALGCVLFEMLAGRPPFEATSAARMMARHVVEPPPRLRSLRPEVPPAVDDAVNRALAKDPAHRFAVVAEFMRAARADSGSRARASGVGAPGIVVLPFVNTSPDAENEYLSDGLTDELINALARVDGIRVASRTSAFALKGKAQDVRAIGALLDCAYVLEGTVRRAGPQLRITAQLTSTSDGRLLWSQRYDRELHDVFAIQDEIARTIVTTLRSTALGDVITGATPRRTSNAKAYSLYLKGRFDLNRRTQEAVASAIRHFNDAIAEDPAYAHAYTGLADAYALQLDYRSVPVHEGLELAEQYAKKAIELDPALAEPHASLAWRRFIYDWDWAAAEEEFRRSFDLDPRYAWAHQLYGFLLSAKGSHGEAIVEGHTAVELDPGSVSARRALAWQYFYARRWDQARFHLDRAITMNPNAEETYRVLGLTLAVEGELAEAERVLREAAAMPEAGSYTLATLGYALARAGRIDDAEEIHRRLRAQLSDGYVSPVAFATILLGLGDVEQALDWTLRALEERRGWLCYLRVNPVMDPMRGNPRFADLLQRMNLL